MTSGLIAAGAGLFGFSVGVLGTTLWNNRKKDDDKQEIRYINPPPQIVQVPVHTTAAQPAPTALQPVSITNNNTNTNNNINYPMQLASATTLPPQYYPQIYQQQPIRPQVMPAAYRTPSYVPQQTAYQPLTWNNTGILNTNYNYNNINWSQLPNRLPQPVLVPAQPIAYIPSPNQIPESNNTLNVFDNRSRILDNSVNIRAEKVYINGEMPSQISSEQPEIAIIPWPSDNISTIQYI